MDFWIKAAIMTSMKSNLYGGSGGASPGGSSVPAPSSPTPQPAAAPLASDSVPAIDTCSLIFSVSSAANVAQGLANNLQNIVERGIPVDEIVPDLRNHAQSIINVSDTFMGNVASLNKMKEGVMNFPQAIIGSLSESEEGLVHTGSNFFKTSVTIVKTAEGALHIKDNLKSEILRQQR